MWERTYIKKAIMTMPYNSVRKMIKYIKESLNTVDCNRDGCTWFSDKEKNTKACINHKDIHLLTNIIRQVVLKDFDKIKKLTKYLNDICDIFTKLNLPIVRCLPTGLKISQSYLRVKSTRVSPFKYSKSTISLNVADKKGRFALYKQQRSLMPNLIHLLDATSMSLLYKEFSDQYKDDNVQLYYIHDCFGITSDKVSTLKTMLASIYIDLYSTDQYLLKFDKYILDYLENHCNNHDTWKNRLNKENRTIQLDEKKHCFKDVNWVINRSTKYT